MVPLTNTKEEPYDNPKEPINSSKELIDSSKELFDSSKELFDNAKEIDLNENEEEKIREERIAEIKDHESATNWKKSWSDIFSVDYYFLLTIS